MSKTVTVEVGQVIDSEGILQAAMEEIEGAIKFAKACSNATAQHVLLIAEPMRVRVEELLHNCMYVGERYPDAYKCLKILREACHWNEEAARNYMSTRVTD